MNNFVYLGSILKIRSILVFLISIVLANDPPIIDPIENQFIDEDSEITLTVIANDIDGDELSYEASSDENVSSVFNNNESRVLAGSCLVSNAMPWCRVPWGKSCVSSFFDTNSGLN